MRALARIVIATVTVVASLELSGFAGDIPRKEDVPKHLGTLKNSSSSKARAEAAEELGRIGAIRASYVTEAIEPLLGTLKNDREANVRRSAALALGRIAPEPKKTVPALMDALKDMSPLVKIGAMQALAMYGPQAKDALPLLRKMAKDKTDKKLSQAARMALKSIQAKK